MKHSSAHNQRILLAIRMKQ